MKQTNERGTPAKNLQSPNYLVQISPEELSDIVRRNLVAVLDERILPDLEGHIAHAVQGHIASMDPKRDDYLTRNETAELLHVTLATLYEMEKRGELLPLRIGRRVLYRRGDIETALKKGRR